MAQQLIAIRTPAAFEGVAAYARQHAGEARAEAYLALGHAYLAEQRYADAAQNLHQARLSGDALADYADYLNAEAQHLAGNESAAEGLLKGFAARYPESILNAAVPELEASALLSLSDPAGAERVLSAAAAQPAAGRAGYQLVLAEVKQALGQTLEAERIEKKVLLGWPLSFEAQAARARLTALGAESLLTSAELRTLADAYYNAGRYDEAAEQYRALLRLPGLDAAARNGFAVAAANCDLKRKRLSREEAAALPDTNDENGARRLYLLMELARDRDDASAQKTYVDQLSARFPKSPWLAEALFSSGNMYLLKKDYAWAIRYYSYLAQHFPEDPNAAAAHWRAGWLSYRLGKFAEAESLFEEQIRLYPTAKETAEALYWRGRLCEQQDKEPARAAAYYQALARAFQHFFYAQMARERLAALGNPAATAIPYLDRYQAPAIPRLEASFPADDPHLVRARLLANAGLNDFIPQEIAATPGSGSWSAIAEAQIYASDGEYFRALRVLKRTLPFAASAPVGAIPLVYWRILFPEPYWETIRAESAKNGLDPYLVASLIRQESEFNPLAISKANAYGLMQLLPSVGKQMAKAVGMGSIEPRQLLDPAINIRLGTHYLRQTIDRFGGVPEYALAAYNAGDDRVLDWQASGPYHGIDEFVESIPFTETRDYVQAILRNQEIYRAIDQLGSPPQLGQSGQSGATQRAKPEASRAALARNR